MTENIPMHFRLTIDEPQSTGFDFGTFALGLAAGFATVAVGTALYAAWYDKQQAAALKDLEARFAAGEDINEEDADDEAADAPAV